MDQKKNCVVGCSLWYILFHVIHATVHHKQIGASNSYSNRLEVLGGGLVELLLSVALGGLTLLLEVVVGIEALGLELTVDEGTGETGEDLLSLGVAVRLA